MDKKQNKTDYLDKITFDNTKLPVDTRKKLKIADISNFHLKLNKAARFDKDKFKLYQKEDTKKNIPGIKLTPNFDKKSLNNVKSNHATMVESLKLSGYNIECLEFIPDWRMIIGLGNESVYETSMTLHHIYGIPYIPGSALKGVTRNYCITNNFSLDPSEREGKTPEEIGKLQEEKALQDKDFCTIFGCPKDSFFKEERKGAVIFFDAFPMNLTNDSIKIDIMNPHYPDYYGGKKKWPTDDQNPIPIFFLTLENVTFNIYIGVKMKDDKEIELRDNEGEILEVTKECVEKSLSEHGIGAKTAVGYGMSKAESSDEKAETIKKKEPEIHTIKNVTISYIAGKPEIKAHISVGKKTGKAFIYGNEAKELLKSLSDDLIKRLKRKKKVTIDVVEAGGSNYKITAIRASS